MPGSKELCGEIQGVRFEFTGFLIVMKNFYELTNRGRARRLRQMALSALQYYDLDIQRVSLLTNEFNGIFRVDTLNGKKYVLRISRSGEHKRVEILSEMMWLAALRRDTLLMVPEPLKARSGDYVTTVSIAGVPEPRHCVVFGWVPGKNLSEQLIPQNLNKTGVFAASLHSHGERFQPPAGFSINIYDQVFPFGDPVVLLDNTYAALFTDEQKSLIQRGIDRVQGVIDELHNHNYHAGVIHADLHQWNVRLYHGQIGAIDFEDLMWGYPLQDIAITFYYLQGREDYQELCQAFRDGYETQREWPEKYPGQLDILIAGRGLDLLNYVLGDKDPEWREQAPAFIHRNEVRLRNLGL